MAAAQPRWKQSSVDADILDPFITLHSPAAPQEKPAEPFRAAASETQLDVEPDFGETKVQAGQNHMAAWDPQPAVPVKSRKSPQRRYSLHGRNRKQLPKSRWSRSR